MKRQLILILSGMMVLSSASGQVKAYLDSLTGNWTGTSLCQVKNSPCHDENVIFHISTGKVADSYTIRADRITNGQTIDMGELNFTLDRSKHTLTCVFPNGTWLLSVTKDHIDGTLTTPDKVLFRKLSLTRDRSTEYANSLYRFSVAIPGDWKLYGQMVNDTIRHKAIVDWGLPPVYSELEKTEIENSISISAYKKENITTVEQLIEAEYLRVDPTKYSMDVDKTAENARLIYATINGLKYKGKSYFVFRNGIGYVINFMATPGTFDKNLPIFEKFRTGIRFL